MGSFGKKGGGCDGWPRRQGRHGWGAVGGAAMKSGGWGMSAKEAMATVASARGGDGGGGWDSGDEELPRMEQRHQTRMGRHAWARSPLKPSNKWTGTHGVVNDASNGYQYQTPIPHLVVPAFSGCVEASVNPVLLYSHASVTVEISDTSNRQKYLPFRDASRRV